MGLFGFGQDKKEGAQSSGQATPEAPVSHKMMWICEKCGFKLVDEETENLARSLQKAVKRKISDDKRKREVRAMVTSCMNICPNKKIAAAIADLKSGSMTFVEFDYKGNQEETADSLYRRL